MYFSKFKIKSWNFSLKFYFFKYKTFDSNVAPQDMAPVSSSAFTGTLSRLDKAGCSYVLVLHMILTGFWSRKQDVGRWAACLQLSCSDVEHAIWRHCGSVPPSGEMNGHQHNPLSAHVSPSQQNTRFMNCSMNEMRFYHAFIRPIEGSRLV